MKVLKCKMLLFFLCFSVFVGAQEDLEKLVEAVQDASVNKQTDIISFLSTTKEHSILIELLKKSGVDELFSTESSYTLFAPTNAGFEKLPKATLESLASPDSKYQLINILNYHILPGIINSSSISKKIASSKGKAKFEAKNGGFITIFNQQGILTINLAKGVNVFIETSDKKQSNGVVHVVDSVLLPQ